MPVERSAGAIIFRKEPFDTAQGKEDKIYYLLLHHPGFRGPKSHWDFPKGKIEKGEKLEETVRREIKEETRIKDMAIINGFKETIKYFFKFEGNNILKFVTFFLAETKKKQVKISPEHIGFKWLPYKEAEVQLTHENAKEILRKANKFLSNGKITPRLTK